MQFYISKQDLNLKTMKLLIQNITLSILLSCISFTAICQTSVEEKNNEFRVYDHYKLIDTLHATPAQIAEVHHLQKIRQLTKGHYYYEFPYAGNLGIRFDNGTVKSEVYEGLSWGDRNFNKSIIIDGDCSIELSALDVTEKNAADYRYRVVQNDNKELITWTVPSTFKYTSDRRFKFAYLGLFKYVRGQVLKVEIYNTKNFRQQDAMLIDWRKVEAADVAELRCRY
jgi:two-component system LytT family sensor kinase